MQNQALAIIHDEHRALGAVAHGLLYLANEIAAGAKPNFPLLWTMARYIGDFPQKLHHPKEETFIFDRLAARTHEADALIAELRAQHEEDLTLVATIRAALRDMEGGVTTAARRFESHVRTFAYLTWRHMNVEENALLPLARAYLTEADWREIGEVFSANGDSRFGMDASNPYHQMFAEIVNLAPAPIGRA